VTWQTFPMNGTRWCSHIENISMSRTITISSWSSWNTALFSTSTSQHPETSRVFVGQQVSRKIVNLTSVQCWKKSQERRHGWRRQCGAVRWWVIAAIVSVRGPRCRAVWSFPLKYTKWVKGQNREKRHRIFTPKQARSCFSGRHTAVQKFAS